MREYEKNVLKKHTPIVAISGNVQASEQASYIQAGMDSFLAKPFKREEFLAVLNRYQKRAEVVVTPIVNGVAAESPTAKDVAAVSKSNGMMESVDENKEGKTNGSSWVTGKSKANATLTGESNASTHGVSMRKNSFSDPNETTTSVPETVQTPSRSSSPPRTTTITTTTTTLTSSPTSSNNHHQNGHHNGGSNGHVRLLVADNSSADRAIYKKMLSQYQVGCDFSFVQGNFP